MKRPSSKRRSKSKSKEAKGPPSRFAPAAFLSGSPAEVQALCEELAKQAASRFADLTGTTWAEVAAAIVAQLRASGHDLHNFDDGEGVSEWQATWHHPRATFSLFLCFRAPASVEVTWKADEATFSARA
jgi:hypothetical protein